MDKLHSQDDGRVMRTPRIAESNGLSSPHIMPGDERHFSDPSDDIDLSELSFVLWKHRWLVLAFVLLGAATATAYAYRQPLIYRAELVAMPVEGGTKQNSLARRFGGLAAIAGVSLGAEGSDKVIAIATLNSYAFKADFIQTHDLMKRMFAGSWDKEKQQWIPDENGNSPSLADGVNTLDYVMRVNEDVTSGLIRVSIDWPRPDVAAEWTNLIVRDVNERLRERAIQEAKQSIEYLTQEVTKTSVVEVQQAIYRLMEEQVKQIMLAKARDQYAFKIIDPAIAPQPADFVSPQRRRIIAIGVVVGLLLGSLAAFLWHGYAAKRKARAASQITATR